MSSCLYMMRQSLNKFFAKVPLSINATKTSKLLQILQSDRAPRGLDCLKVRNLSLNCKIEFLEGLLWGRGKRNKEQRFWPMLFGCSSRKTVSIIDWGFHLQIVKKDWRLNFTCGRQASSPTSVTVCSAKLPGWAQLHCPPSHLGEEIAGGCHKSLDWKKPQTLEYLQKCCWEERTYLCCRSRFFFFQADPSSIPATFRAAVWFVGRRSWTLNSSE